MTISAITIIPSGGCATIAPVSYNSNSVKHHYTDISTNVLWWRCCTKLHTERETCYFSGVLL